MRVAGVRVGEVTGIKVKDQRVADVTFTVSADRVVPRSTQARIRYRNLIGQRYVALTQGTGDATPMRAGETIPLERTQPALDLSVLFNGFKPLFAALSPADVNKLANEIIRTLQGEGGTVTSLLAHTASLTSALADRDQLIGDTVTNLNTVLATLDQRDQRLSDLIGQLQRLVSGLAADRTSIGASLTNINALTTTTADLLVKARGPLRADINQLGALVTTLDENSPLVERFLDQWDDKLRPLVRAGAYGSWFNMFLCDFEGAVVLPSGTDLPPVTYRSNAARCTP